MAELVYPPVVRLVLGVFRALDLRLDVAGKEHVPAHGGGVVVMNHTGYLDFALAGVPYWRGARRLIRFMAKQEVFQHRLGGPIMRGMHHISVDRSSGGAAFREAVAALRRSELVGVFPEATISRSFCLKEFKPGAVQMARAANVPLLPLALWGSQRIYTKGRKPSLAEARHVPVTMTLGPALDAKHKDAQAHLRSELARLLEESQARYPDRPAGAWWLPAHLGGSAPTPEEAARIDAELALARRQNAPGQRGSSS
ncbi:MAG: 1-acyl-sn-glycerol-3-phosphate acyltransferase [Actinomycetota bacterium]|nr:1-acyl-sn-glycerol-3-phosphate acyltransferase [Actinomycetota bacterium]